MAEEIGPDDDLEELPTQDEAPTTEPEADPYAHIQLPELPDSEMQVDPAHHKKLFAWMDAINICDYLDDDLLNAIGQRVVREFEIDWNSLSDWRTKSEKAMKLAMQTAEEKQYPWPRASNVIYPLITVGATQFAARAYPAIINGKNVVKGVVIGDDKGVPAVNPQTGQPPLINPQTGQPAWIVQPGEKRVRAAKVGEHMSWQLLDEQTEWEEETDRLLHILPIVGCAFRKTYYDVTKVRNVSLLVTAQMMVINYHAKSLESAPRVTEVIMLYPMECQENEMSGMFREVDYTPEPNSGEDEDAPREFIEQHRWLDLDEDGFPEPYIVTVHKASAKVVRIVARYDADGIHLTAKGEIYKIDPIHYYTQYNFLPNPEGGLYGMGFGQLLRPINEAINTSLNMLIDMGHLNVTGGGFIGKGLSMATGNVRFTPGEYKAVNVPGATVKENIVPLTFNPPSPILFQLLGMLVEAGKEISAVKDVLTGEQKNSNVPATTTLALIEQGLKTFTAIYKRVHRSLKKELDKQFRLNRLHLPEKGTGYRINNEWRYITREDYAKSNGVEPVSDPSMVSDMQKLARAQFLMGFANDPLCNPIEIRRRVFDGASIEKIDEILLSAPPPNPEMLAKATELETRHERTRAEATKDYAQALLFLTQAQQVAAGTNLQWIESQLEVFKARMEHLNGPEGLNPGGNNGPGLPAMEAPSGQQGAAQIPSGLPQGAEGGNLAGAAPGQGA